MPSVGRSAPGWSDAPSTCFPTWIDALVAGDPPQLSDFAEAGPHARRVYWRDGGFRFGAAIETSPRVRGGRQSSLAGCGRRGVRRSSRGDALGRKRRRRPGCDRASGATRPGPGVWGPALPRHFDEQRIRVLRSGQGRGGFDGFGGRWRNLAHRVAGNRWGASSEPPRSQRNPSVAGAARGRGRAHPAPTVAVVVTYSARSPSETQPGMPARWEVSFRRSMPR